MSAEAAPAIEVFYVAGVRFEIGVPELAARLKAHLRPEMTIGEVAMLAYPYELVPSITRKEHDHA